MKLFSRFAIILLSGILLFVVSSCKHEGEYDHTEVTVFYSCSEDVFEFFTPVVMITNSDGSIREISLNRKDFQKHKMKEKSYVAGDNSSQVERSLYYYRITERIQSLKGNLNIIIKNVPTRESKNNSGENYFIVEGISSYRVDVCCQNGHSIKQKEETFQIMEMTTGVDDFQDINDPIQRFEQMLHLISHTACTFDLAYNIKASEDDIEFDGNCVVGFKTIDHINTLNTTE